MVVIKVLPCGNCGRNLQKSGVIGWRKLGEGLVPTPSNKCFSCGSAIDHAAWFEYSWSAKQLIEKYSQGEELNAFRKDPVNYVNQKLNPKLLNAHENTSIVVSRKENHLFLATDQER